MINIISFATNLKYNSNKFEVSSLNTKKSEKSFKICFTFS